MAGAETPGPKVGAPDPPGAGEAGGPPQPPSAAGKPAAPIIICRCEDITLEELRAWIARGYGRMEELKRISRCGMGACQGRTCRPLVARELARAAGLPLEQVEESQWRPPTRPVKLGLLAAAREAARAGGEAREAGGDGGGGEGGEGRD